MGDRKSDDVSDELKEMALELDKTYIKADKITCKELKKVGGGNMPETAIKGIYRDGKIIPKEEIPFKEDMNVIIVFTDKYDQDEARYYEQGWQVAETEASEDYKVGNIKSADTVDQMFNEIEGNINL